MIKRILSALAVALVSGFVASAQEYKGPELTPEFVCDLGQITPENVKVKGSTQGFAIWGKYGFVLHDKGQCVIIDMKRTSSFPLSSWTETSRTATTHPSAWKRIGISAALHLRMQGRSLLLRHGHHFGWEPGRSETLSHRRGLHRVVRLVHRQEEQDHLHLWVQRRDAETDKEIQASCFEGLR